MSTFITAPGFDARPENRHNAKTSILVASVLPAILGVLYIRFDSTKNITRHSIRYQKRRELDESLYNHSIGVIFT